MLTVLFRVSWYLYLRRTPVCVKLGICGVVDRLDREGFYDSHTEVAWLGQGRMWGECNSCQDWQACATLWM